jgi:hypothetical protein
MRGEIIIFIDRETGKKSYVSSNKYYIKQVNKERTILLPEKGIE